MDADGLVRIHDPSKVFQLKYECAGVAKKLLRFNSTKTKLYFISANDRANLVEVDLSSNDFKIREKAFKYGKIIDFVLVNDEELVTLNKEGWVEIKNLLKKDKKLYSNTSSKTSISAGSHSHSRNNSSLGSKTEEEDIIFKLEASSVSSNKRRLQRVHFSLLSR